MLASEVSLIVGCIEATPAVWDGAIYVATRGRKFFALR